MKPPAWESLWTVRDVANYLQASRSWVYERCASGRMPCIHVGGLLRFEAETIRKWALAPRPPGR